MDEVAVPPGLSAEDSMPTRKAGPPSTQEAPVLDKEEAAFSALPQASATPIPIYPAASDRDRTTILMAILEEDSQATTRTMASRQIRRRTLGLTMDTTKTPVNRTGVVNRMRTTTTMRERREDRTTAG